MKDASPLLAYVGDDFSGSTDVMDVLARRGLQTLLFARTPDPGMLERAQAYDAIGIATNLRATAADSIDGVLRPLLQMLLPLRVPVVHYKVCSTFDSSAEVGSIGRALDVASQVFDATPVPILAAAPDLGRYCVFGNLFARSGATEPFRLDRHPTMSTHPITPMSESDLRMHLATQTDGRVALMDVLTMAAGPQAAVRRYAELRGTQPRAILIDALTPAHMRAAGAAIASQLSVDRPTFVVGSSGVEDALAEALAGSGRARDYDPPRQLHAARPVLVLSGSCSPVTHRQIGRAVAHGYREIAVDSSRATSDHAPAEVIDVACRTVELLRRGEHVVVHTALGSEDQRIARARASVARSGVMAAQVATECGFRLGRALGRIASAVLGEVAVGRLVVAGGDTGSRVAHELRIDTLEVASQLTPGSPLCLARGDESPADQAEIVFKGGQVGSDDLMIQVAEGSKGG
jgi:uncharacterized protein YgbK (DUF1537 family)